ncbi:MAG: cytidine deaminase [Spirochaetes bacterium]|nr:cytidine deaminase [Spirochaetota bacterium]
MKTTNYKGLTNPQKNLLDAAEKAAETAYNPYSQFFVGAALLTHNDIIITGSNIENASYSCAICAERAALSRANAMGHKKYKSIAIIARRLDSKIEEVITPCGICRQMLYEASQVSENDIEIIMSNTKKDKIIISSIKELLPLAFGPKNTGVDVKKYH